MGAAAQPARAGQPAGITYERRRPEETTLYQVVQEELVTFLPQAQAHTGSSLPQFVKDAFDAFLEGGTLAHGFNRLRCSECAHEKLAALMCRRRGSANDICKQPLRWNLPGKRFVFEPAVRKRKPAITGHSPYQYIRHSPALPSL